MTSPPTESNEDTSRLDRWLWAARLFKTRQLAVQAVKAGRVEVNGVRVKPAKTLRTGDRVVVTKDTLSYRLEVTGLAPRRVSAAIAPSLYREDATGREERERRVAEMRAHRARGLRTPGRPTKRDRRVMERMRRSGE